MLKPTYEDLVALLREARDELDCLASFAPSEDSVLDLTRRMGDSIETAERKDVIQFVHPNGDVLTLTRDPQDPTKWATAYTNGDTVVDRVLDCFATLKK